MSGQPRLVVGIDLGTTHTVVAWSRLGDSEAVGAQVFPVPQLVSSSEVAARPLLPSYLYAPHSGETVPDQWNEGPWVLGEHARQRGREVPGRLVSSAKSWLCHGGVDRRAAILPWGREEYDDRPRLSPVEASTRLLQHVRVAWNAAHPDAPLEQQQVVLTVPASFDQAARELTLHAAAAAFLTVRLLEEPQAAFYDFLWNARGSGLVSRLAEAGALVLVCDVGGGTTDLSLIRLQQAERDQAINRIAVGRHLLLGGDNMDLALAHHCEPQLVDAPSHLDAPRFGQLALACRNAKELLLGADPPDSVPVSVAGSGASLVGSARSTRLERRDAERLVLDGFFPHVGRGSKPKPGRAGLMAFGLPYEHDAGITRHIAAFLARHGSANPTAVLLNGGVFRAAKVTERLLEVLGSWGDQPVVTLPAPNPDVAVARGAVAYGIALATGGVTIGGGTPRGYYIGLEGPQRRALCVIPRGAREGERHLAIRHPLALRVGQAARFELFASDDALVDPPGAVVELDAERFLALPPLTAVLGEPRTTEAEVEVHLEGELTAIGTLDLACVENAGPNPERFRLAFDLRAAATPSQPPSAPQPRRGRSVRLDEAREVIHRVFGKSRGDVKPREIKDLWRNLERILGERREWTTEQARALFDTTLPLARARRRTPDHERLFWMLSSFCLRPGFGHPEDPRRILRWAPVLREGVHFASEARSWQQYFIAARRTAGGLAEPIQVELRDLLDPFLAPAELKLKKRKNFRPMSPDEQLELVAWLERVPSQRRTELGRWLLERTWTSRDPRLWTALGRVGARVPAYASVHHVVPPSVVERWLDHLLREKWEQVPTAARTAVELARVTGDRARDVSAQIRQSIERRLVLIEAPAEWVRSVRECVPIAEDERAAQFGEALPAGLRLAEPG